MQQWYWVRRAFWDNIRALDDKFEIWRQKLFYLNDKTLQTALIIIWNGSQFLVTVWACSITSHIWSSHYAEMPDNISVRASDSDLKMQVCSGDREWFCCLAIRVLKFSWDGTAMCNDRLGSKHLCAQGPGLQWIEIRQERISCGSKLCSPKQRKLCNQSRS